MVKGVSSQSAVFKIIFLFENRSPNPTFSFVRIPDAEKPDVFLVKNNTKNDATSK